jgi:kumamolisin
MMSLKILMNKTMKKASQQRLSTPKMNNSQLKYTPLPGSKKRAPLKGRSLGATDPKEQITVTVLLRRHDQKGFERHFKDHVCKGVHLEPEVFCATKFGASTEDVAAVKAFAKQHGLKVLSVHTHGRTVKLKGTVEQFNKAFKVTLKRYKTSQGEFRVRTTELQVPENLKDIIIGAFGLDNRPKAKPHFRRRQEKKGISVRAQDQSFSPVDVAKIYDFPSDLTGKGETIGIIELGGGFKSNQLLAYFRSIGISNPPTVTAVSIDGGKNTLDGPDGADGEVQLDIEVAGAVATEAAQKVYFAPNTTQGFLDAIIAAVHDPEVSVISISWGMAEDYWDAQDLEAFDAAFQDATVLGKTVFAASGDDGSTDGLEDGKPHVDFPASSPYVVACGGTKLAASVANGIQSETVWNELANGEGATGGGISPHFARPSYQSKARVPKGSQGNVGRGVPDVAAVADPVTGYKVSIDGLSAVIGGTSAVSPLYAGLFALINQARKAKGKPSVGFAHPQLYTAKTAFRDILKGNNGAYKANSSWDACTGMGSPKGKSLLDWFLKI